MVTPGGISEVIVMVGQRMMEVEGSEEMERGAARDCCKKVPLPFERANCQPFRIKQFPTALSEGKIIVILSTKYMCLIFRYVEYLCPRYCGGQSHPETGFYITVSGWLGPSQYWFLQYIF